MSDPRELQIAVLRTRAAGHPSGIQRIELMSMIEAVERVRLTRAERATSA